MSYHILYMQNIKINLRNFWDWNSERQSGISPVNLEQEHQSFICGFIHYKKNSTHRTQVALAPLSTVCNFRKKGYIVQDVLKAFSETWHFPWMQKSSFFSRYVKTEPHSNATYFTAFQAEIQKSLINSQTWHHYM